MQNPDENFKKQGSTIWWRRGLALILLLEFAILIWVTTGSYYRDLKPPIPEKVLDNSGLVVFSGSDIKNGQLGLAFLIFAIRQVSSEENWKRVEKYVKISFWGLNLGLAGMVVLQLFPSGVMQLLDVIKNGYWHARSLEFSGQQHIVNLAWLRLPADFVFIGAGVLPLLFAVILTYFNMRKSGKTIAK